MILSKLNFVLWIGELHALHLNCYLSPYHSWVIVIVIVYPRYSVTVPHPCLHKWRCNRPYWAPVQLQGTRWVISRADHNCTWPWIRGMAAAASYLHCCGHPEHRHVPHYYNTLVVTVARKHISTSFNFQLVFTWVKRERNVDRPTTHVSTWQCIILLLISPEFVLAFHVLYARNTNSRSSCVTKIPKQWMANNVFF